MTKPTITQVENAFQPAKEVDDPSRFAGRKDYIQEAYLGLLTEGSHIAIVGNRGIGKTSLSRQVVKIATGDNSILEKLAIAQDRKQDYLSVYFACGNSIRNVDELLERLLTNTNCLADWIYDIPKASKIVSGYAPKFSAGLAGVNFELGGKKETETNTSVAITEHSTDSVFTNVANAIVQENISKDGLLIVIDEFDQIKDPTGFASFLKAISTNAPNVKFCIVGVAQDIYNLMQEHASADRLFSGSVITLPSMTKDELMEIVAIAENSISRAIQFSKPAFERIADLAQGHPYMVHLIGKYALRHAFQASKVLITEADVDETLKSIADRAADPALEGRYKKAVASSEHREIVIKAFADSIAADGEVWTTTAYKAALDLGVDNASQYVGQLVTEDYGGELIKLRDRYYRFKDSLFSAYVKARPRLVSKGG